MIPQDFHECAAAGYSKRKTSRILGCTLARVCKMEIELGLVFYNIMTPLDRRVISA